MKQSITKSGIVNVSSIWISVKQFLKFSAVGLSNTLLSLMVYYFLVYFAFHYIVAHVFAFIISVINAVYWNSRYVFRNNNGKKTGVIIKAYISYGFTFLLSSVLLIIMVDIVKISSTVAPLVNLLITVPLNFLLNKLWVFK